MTRYAVKNFVIKVMMPPQGVLKLPWPKSLSKMGAPKESYDAMKLENCLGICNNNSNFKIF